MMNDFADLTLLNESGESIEMRRLWTRQTAVLVFVRHFG